MTGPAADLVVLLNPAFEASIFTAMHTVNRPDSIWWESINERQQPLLLSIATDNDWATGRLFPLGQSLGFARRARQRITLGNYKDYVTHSLQLVTPSDGSPPSVKFWYDHFEAAGLVLLRKANANPGNPFFVARTTSDIIDGHNDIWQPTLSSWMVSFLLELHKRRAAV